MGGAIKGEPCSTECGVSPGRPHPPTSPPAPRLMPPQPPPPRHPPPHPGFLRGGDSARPLVGLNIFAVIRALIPAPHPPPPPGAQQWGDGVGGARGGSAGCCSDGVPVLSAAPPSPSPAPQWVRQCCGCPPPLCASVSPLLYGCGSNWFMGGGLSRAWVCPQLGGGLLRWGGSWSHTVLWVHGGGVEGCSSSQHPGVGVPLCTESPPTMLGWGGSAHPRAVGCCRLGGGRQVWVLRGRFIRGPAFLIWFGWAVGAV